MGDAYLAERIRDALAGDGVAELGISVTVAADHVLLTGDVATAARKEAVGEAVAPFLEGRTLHNSLTVARPTEPDELEEIP